MSDDYKNLPSIDDFAESSEELPSVAELLEEEERNVINKQISESIHNLISSS